MGGVIKILIIERKIRDQLKIYQLQDPINIVINGGLEQAWHCTYACIDCRAAEILLLLHYHRQSASVAFPFHKLL